MKRVLVLILATFVLFILSSCGLDYRFSLDDELHNQIEYVSEDEASAHIIYQGGKYLHVGSTNLFSVDTYKVEDNYYKSYDDDILLSWNGSRYVWYIDEYYSDTAEKPLFIYNERVHDVFFHEDYDYLKDTFVIENTDDEIVYEKIFDTKQDSFNFTNPVRVSMTSKLHSRIKTYVEIEFSNNQWYLTLPDSNDVWIASDEFINLLLENEIIEI